MKLMLQTQMLVTTTLPILLTDENTTAKKQTNETERNKTCLASCCNDGIRKLIAFYTHSAAVLSHASQHLQC